MKRLRQYIEQLAPERPLVKAGAESVLDNVQVDTAAQAPLPQPGDETLFQNDGAWEAFTRGE